MAVNRNFGDAGLIWTANPRDVTQHSQFWDPDQRYLGGSAVGVLADPSGPAVVCWGRSPERGTAYPEVFIAAFPANGAPAPEFTAAGTIITRISEQGLAATPLACCDAPGGGAVLLRHQSERQVGPGAVRFDIRQVRPAQVGWSVVTTIPVHASGLVDPGADPSPSPVQMISIAAGFVVVSAGTRSARVAQVDQAGTTTAHDLPLGGPGSALPGLVDLGVASVGFDGTWLSIALTAQLNHPGIGAASVGAILRVTPGGARDAGFGDNGLWVGPISLQLRNFVCVAGFPHCVVGFQDRDQELIAIAPGPGGTDLDDTFGVGGILRFPLGAKPIRSAAAVDDGNYSYFFARVDERIAGCRFDRGGQVATSFGVAGIAAVPADGPTTRPEDVGVALLPVQAKIAGGRIRLALTWLVRGIDFDRLPAVAVIDPNTGALDQQFGAAGFALHDAVGRFAAVLPDGTTFHVERIRDWIESTIVLRRADAGGRFVTRISLATPGVSGAEIADLCATENGLVVGGAGVPGWLARLRSDGTPDPTFGTGGVVTVGPVATAASVTVVGVLPDGRVTIMVEDRISRLQSDGTPDPSFAEGGSLAVAGFRHISSPTNPVGPPSSSVPLLQDDGSIICAIGSSAYSTTSPSPQIGLRRITPAGAYDRAFGLAPPDVLELIAPAGTIISLVQGTGSSRSGFSSGMPVGAAWMGGLLYVIAAVTSGGLVDPHEASGRPSPAYDALLVSRWHADGHLDLAFGGTGYQLAGLDPDAVQYRPGGIALAEATSLLVFGTAGAATTVTHSVGGQSYQLTLLERPEPAVFTVRHPSGFDASFGQGGADRLQIQEFQGRVIAARGTVTSLRRLDEVRVRFVCLDPRTQMAIASHPSASSLGGVGEFRYQRLRWPGPQASSYRPESDAVTQ